MGQPFATCGHDITAYPWDYPGVWIKGWNYTDAWSFSTLCMDCILAAMKVGCIVQFSTPEELK